MGISKIIKVIQTETSKSDINSMGTIIDFIINIDKYKAMFSMFNKIMSSPEGLKNPSELFNIIGPLIGGENQKNNDKFKEMAKMMEILNVINIPTKEHPNTFHDDKVIEVIEKPPKNK